MTFMGKRICLAVAAVLWMGSGIPNLSIDTAHAGWTDIFKLKGDFRYRYETADKEGSEERTRHRIRARLGISAEVTESVSVHVQLASGSEDPVSTNQSLDEAFSTKGIHLDRAYVQWKASKCLTLMAGKTKNPFYVPGGSELIWDGDLNPEGMALGFVSGSSFKVWANAAYLLVDERSSTTDDCFLFGGQAGLTVPMGDATLKLGGGFYSYANQEGFETFGGDFGNSTDADGNYTMDFVEIEAFADFSAKIGSFPIGFHGHYVVNNEADENDTGYQFGLSLGKAKDPMSWQLKYCYKEVESDAVVGAFTDSDFIGGGTDGKGHEIEFAFAMAKNCTVGASYFMNEIGLEGTSIDYDRLMVDLVFKF
ncbi:putative porin [bacterium]|nr:putative porin [candidate division CSSED10-310 bacterium]